MFIESNLSIAPKLECDWHFLLGRETDYRKKRGGLTLSPLSGLAQAGNGLEPIFRRRAWWIASTAEAPGRPVIRRIRWRSPRDWPRILYVSDVLESRIEDTAHITPLLVIGNGGTAGVGHTKRPYVFRQDRVGAARYALRFKHHHIQHDNDRIRPTRLGPGNTSLVDFLGHPVEPSLRKRCGSWNLRFLKILGSYPDRISHTSMNLTTSRNWVETPHPPACKGFEPTCPAARSRASGRARLSRLYKLASTEFLGPSPRLKAVSAVGKLFALPDGATRLRRLWPKKFSGALIVSLSSGEAMS